MQGEIGPRDPEQLRTIDGLKDELGATSRGEALENKRVFTIPWRRRRDSNPRYAFTAYNGLANRRLQPLGHVSGAIRL